jgi:SAM-dependent methyltransferase
VASVPNVAHASIRLSLLKGEFNYTEMGLLDRTHLRFFTRETLADLFHSAGYEVRAWRRIITDPFATEMQLREEEFPPYLREAARNDAEALTYQFVVSAYPVKSGRNGQEPVESTEQPQKNLVDHLWRWQHEHQAKEASLSHALAQRNATLTDREELLARRERSLQEANAELAAINESQERKLAESGRRAIRWLSSGSWRSGKSRSKKLPATEQRITTVAATAAAEASPKKLTEAQYYRRQLAGLCHGRGIELSPRDAPTQGLPSDAVVLYADSETTRQLKDRLKPAPAAKSLVPVDVIADSSCLPFTTNGLDFVIANDLIGRIPNPLGAFQEWHRCLKEGGRLFLTVPDERFCFGGDRAPTGWEHLQADLDSSDNGLSNSSREHLRDWIRSVEGVSEKGVDARLDELLSTTLDYRWHTWTYESLLGTLDHCGRELGLRFEREAELNSYETWGEMALVLRKQRDAADVLPGRYSFPEWKITTKDRILGELLPGNVLEQSFTCSQKGLNAIHVRFGTYSRANSGPLVFALFRENAPEPIARLEADLSELRDNFFHAFRFSPMKGSAGRRFRFTLECPDATPDNAVTVWAADYDDGDLEMKANGSPVEGTALNFKAFSIATLNESDAWSGMSSPVPAARTDVRRSASDGARSRSKGAKRN